jgi:hypothetical protein
MGGSGILQHDLTAIRLSPLESRNSWGILSRGILGESLASQVEESCQRHPPKSSENAGFDAFLTARF